MEKDTKSKIQEAFVKYHIVNSEDRIKAMLEDVEGMSEIYDGFENKEEARAFFSQAIREVIHPILENYGLSHGKKKEHELLAERLEGIYENLDIDKNVNGLILKTTANTSAYEGIDVGVDPNSKYIRAWNNMNKGL